MKWPEINKLMSMQCESSLDLQKTRDQLFEKLQVFDKAFFNLEICQVESGNIIKEHNFDFVPFPCSAFVDLLIEGYHFLGRDNTKKFIDIGCGLGTKVILACSLFDAYGIDYDQKHVEKAKALGLNRVGQADALTFDKYDLFDFIFYFRPIFDKDKYNQLEGMIYKSLKPGALVAPMFSEFDWDSLSDMEKLSDYVYRKKL